MLQEILESIILSYSLCQETAESYLKNIVNDYLTLIIIALRRISKGYSVDAYSLPTRKSGYC